MGTAKSNAEHTCVEHHYCVEASTILSCLPEVACCAFLLQAVPTSLLRHTGGSLELQQRLSPNASHPHCSTQTAAAPCTCSINAAPHTCTSHPRGSLTHAPGLTRNLAQSQPQAAASVQLAGLQGEGRGSLHLAAQPHAAAAYFS